MNVFSVGIDAMEESIGRAMNLRHMAIVLNMRDIAELIVHRQSRLSPSYFAAMRWMPEPEDIDLLIQLRDRAITAISHVIMAHSHLEWNVLAAREGRQILSTDEKSMNEAAKVCEDMSNNAQNRKTAMAWHELDLDFQWLVNRIGTNKTFAVMTISESVQQGRGPRGCSICNVALSPRPNWNEYSWRRVNDIFDDTYHMLHLVQACEDLGLGAADRVRTRLLSLEWLKNIGCGAHPFFPIFKKLKNGCSADWTAENRNLIIWLATNEMREKLNREMKHQDLYFEIPEDDTSIYNAYNTAMDLLASLRDEPEGPKSSLLKVHGIDVTDIMEAVFGDCWERQMRLYPDLTASKD